jgi:hypothetical protein
MWVTCTSPNHSSPSGFCEFPEAGHIVREPAGFLGTMVTPRDDDPDDHAAITSGIKNRITTTMAQRRVPVVWRAAPNYRDSQLSQGTLCDAQR